MNLMTRGKIEKVKVFKDNLANGMTVVVVEQPHIHSIEMAMFVRSGLRFENMQNNGISHFLSTCFLEVIRHTQVRIYSIGNLNLLAETLEPPL